MDGPSQPTDPDAWPPPQSQPRRPGPPAPSGWGPPPGYGTAPPVAWSPEPVGEPPQPPKAPPNRRAGFVLLAVFLVAEFVFVAASVLVVLPFAVADPRFADGGPLPPVALALALAVPTMLAALTALAGSLALGAGPRQDLNLRWDARELAVGLGLGVGGLLLTIPASALWAEWVGPERANSAVGEVFGDQRMTLGLAILVFLVVWLVAPLCEEVLYRGILWSALERFRWNQWLIFGVTTVVFSVAHLELLRTPLLLVISLPIGLARMLTGNTLASVVAHQANNLLPAVGLLLVLLGVAPV